MAQGRQQPHLSTAAFTMCLPTTPAEGCNNHNCSGNWHRATSSLTTAAAFRMRLSANMSRSVTRQHQLLGACSAPGTAALEAAPCSTSLSASSDHLQHGLTVSAQIQRLCFKTGSLMIQQHHQLAAAADVSI